MSRASPNGHQLQPRSLVEVDPDQQQLKPLAVLLDHPCRGAPRRPLGRPRPLASSTQPRRAGASAKEAETALPQGKVTSGFLQGRSTELGFEFGKNESEFGSPYYPLPKG